MVEKAKNYQCRFYVEGACLFLKKHPVVIPSLARVRRPHREGLTAVLDGGPRLTANRNYVCAAQFSLDPGAFQRTCTVTPLQLVARFDIIT